MKQQFIILFFIIGFYNIAFTQDENDLLKNEWSANINFFFNDLLLSKDMEENIIGYQAPVESIVTYRRYFNKKYAWQIGVKFFDKNSDEDFVSGFGGEQTQYKKGYYLRTGFQKYHHLSNKVKFYFGTDLLFSFQKYKAYILLDETPFSPEQDYTHINREKEIGIVPHLGFRWEINSRISFSTETSLIASYVWFDLDLDSPFSSQPIIFGDFNTLQRDAEKFSFTMQQPIILLINFRF